MEAAESFCSGTANTGSTSNVDQERRDSEDHLQLFDTELHDDSDIQIPDCRPK